MDTHEKRVNILVKRFHSGDTSYLSFHNLPLSSGSSEYSSGTSGGSSENNETLSLTFFRSYDDYGVNSECNGLLCFDNFRGKIVICNPTTKQLKFLPPARMEKRPNLTCVGGTGFGYDRISQDYKVVRILFHTYYDDEEHEIGEKTVAEVYAFKRESWKEIEFDDDMFMFCGGAYVSGKYYWQTPEAGILSFDFATEIFSTLSLPTSDDYYLFDFIDLGDKLGVIVYAKPVPSKPNNMIEVWVFEEGSWTKSFHVALDNVVRPLGLKHDLLFFEGKSMGELSQLLVYDLKAEKLEPLEIFDYPENMDIFSYIENPYRLPDEKPMDGMYSDDEDTYAWDGDTDEDLGH